MISIRHVGLVVKDIELSLTFYRDLLGLEEMTRQEYSGEYVDKLMCVKDGNMTVVKLHSGAYGYIELIQFKNSVSEELPDKHSNDIGVQHIAFSVDSVQTMYDFLISVGVVFNSEPVIAPNGVIKLVYCKDFEGNFVEFMEVLR